MRKGIIPLILGTAVTATGLALRGQDMRENGMTNRDTKVAIGGGIIGLGVAHVILGSIDFFED